MLVDFDMPILRPVRIPTGDSSISKWAKIKIWLFQARKFELMEDWHFTWDFEPATPTRIIIKEGFVFDGASIPRVLWFILNPFGILLIPGLLHDWFYKYNSFTTRRTLPDQSQAEVLMFVGRGQKFADKFFRDVAIKVNGMKILNYISYCALRCCGSAAWNKHRKKEF